MLLFCYVCHKIKKETRLGTCIIRYFGFYDQKLSKNIFWNNPKKFDFCGPESHLRESTISDLESPSNFQIKEKKLFKSIHKQENWTLAVLESFEGKYNIGFGISGKFPSQRIFFIQISP